MDNRYERIERIIEQWFSFELSLGVNDIMPEVVFLYEQNKELKKEILDIKRNNDVEK